MVAAGGSASVSTTPSASLVTVGGSASATATPPGGAVAAVQRPIVSPATAGGYGWRFACSGSRALFVCNQTGAMVELCSRSNGWFRFQETPQAKQLCIVFAWFVYEQKFKSDAEQIAFLQRGGGEELVSSDSWRRRWRFGTWSASRDGPFMLLRNSKRTSQNLLLLRNGIVFSDEDSKFSQALVSLDGATRCLRLAAAAVEIDKAADLATEYGSASANTALRGHGGSQVDW